uniref:major facilitator superfamily domain-containing protein 6-like n=1 Tax=Myxine glutinosa TaxID=7769 RepID=UPI00358F52A3
MDVLGGRGNMTALLHCLVQASKKAAAIARLCRSENALFELLVQEKTGEDKNKKFVSDFKTLADVLIQEVIKHDVGVQFPVLVGHIHGEENSKFTNGLGQTETVRVCASVADTAMLLTHVLDGNTRAGQLLADAVHAEPEAMVDRRIGALRLDEPPDDLAIWVDPIDSTNQYIQGGYEPSDHARPHSQGLPCVTVLIGVYERIGGLPVMGIVNQPFVHYDSESSRNEVKTRRLKQLGPNMENDKAPILPENTKQTKSDTCPSIEPSAKNSEPDDEASCFNRRCINLGCDDLTISKLYYFFYFGAYGSFFPLLPVYYKQLAMTPFQGGILMGIRYFIEFCSAPLWGMVADYSRKGKLLLLSGLLCWAAFNLAVGFMPPVPGTCVSAGLNHTKPENIITKPEQPSLNNRRRRSAIQKNIEQSPTWEFDFFIMDSTNPLQRKIRDNVAGEHTNGITPQTVTEHGIRASIPVVKPYQVLFNNDDIRYLFLLLLLLVIFSEFLGTPALTIADAVTLMYLGESRNSYGQQRMWGALGWATLMFTVSVLIDFTTIGQSGGSHVEPPCKITDPSNYHVAFVAFAIMTATAFIVATQFNFTEHRHVTDMTPETQEDVELEQVKGKYNSNVQPGTLKEQDLDDLVGILCSVRYGSVLYITWFTGCCYGFLATFLYWHLGDLKGTPVLFGLCSLLLHLSEVVTFFFSQHLFRLLGCITVLCLALCAAAFEMIWISFLRNPWLVLPVTIMQGFMMAATWTSCISILNDEVAPARRTTVQGIIQGLHLGLGRGCGAILGGLLVHTFGAVNIFRAIGIASLISLILFALIQWLINRSKKNPDNLTRPPQGSSTDGTSKPDTQDTPNNLTSAALDLLKLTEETAAKQGEAETPSS